MSAGSIRARVRAEMIDEIKSTARGYLATDGANLSLRAVARDMGMVSSALYRYFASRDDLLTALIIDAYNALGAAAEAGDAAVLDRADLLGRWLATCRAVRDWALEHPAEYALIFGSPVPGYLAPTETIIAATRTPTVLMGLVKEGYDTGAIPDPGGDLSDDVRADLARLREQAIPGVPETLLARGMLGWTLLFGAVSFELFGQLNNVVEARESYFDLQMRHTASVIGIGGAAVR